MEAIRAPRGTRLSCKGWVQEAALRMLMNNLDPEVAERPEDLVVYGGTGKAARDWESHHRIVAALRTLGEDETLLVQSGKPVGVLGTHPDAPRVLIANSNLVPRFATWEHFWDLERRGLIMYGQMTAGSWIYIGTQGILQGTYETFAQAGRTHFGTDDLAGRLILSGGLGGMGGAQPLAATMLGAAFLGVDIDPARIEKRLQGGYLDARADDLDDALLRLDDARRARRPLSIGLVGNAATVFGELSRRGIAPDLVTDQTSAHDPLNGYVPADVPLADAPALRRRDPRATSAARRSRWRARSRRCSPCAAPGATCSTTATTSAPARARRASPTRSPTRASCRPTSGRCSARGRAVPLGGALRRSGRHRPHRRRGRGALPGGCGAAPLARSRCTQGEVPGAAGADLLARLRGARSGGAGVQRSRPARRAEGADRHRPRPPRLWVGRVSEP